MNYAINIEIYLSNVNINFLTAFHFSARTIFPFLTYANYVYLATDLTGTGLRSLEYFTRIAAEYYGTIYSYLPTKEQKAKQKDPIYGSNSFLAVTDRPRFSFQEELLLARLASGFTCWGILLFFKVQFLG